MHSHKPAPIFLPLSPPPPTAAAAALLPRSESEMYCHSPFFPREEEDNRNNNKGRSQHLVFADQSSSALTFHPQEDALDFSSNSMFSLKPGNAAVLTSSNFHYPPPPSSSSLNQVVVVSSPTRGGEGILNTGQYMYRRETTCNNNNIHNNNNNYIKFSCTGKIINNSNNNIENWGESAVADTSQQTEAFTDIDTDEKCQDAKHNSGAVVVDQSRTKTGDQKTFRRLAQNREAARRSRLRKKAYVQQLEASKLRFAQLAQELQRVRQQGTFGSHGHSMAGNGAVAFDMDYARWLVEHHRLISDLRSAVNSHVGDNELGLRVDGVMAHYDEIFCLKSIGVKADVFHVLSGMWKSPVERCFMWLGGFRSSELLKILGNHLEPLADRQLMGLCNLQQSSQQAEDALSQGMEALQQSLVDTLSSASLGPAGAGSVSDYMGQMAIAMGKLAMLESLVHQADLLRQKTLQQMHQILTTRQAARALLVISDYSSRLRALSSLWLACPRNS